MSKISPEAKTCLMLGALVAYFIGCVGYSIGRHHFGEAVFHFVLAAAMGLLAAQWISIWVLEIERRVLHEDAALAAATAGTEGT